MNSTGGALLAAAGGESWTREEAGDRSKIQQRLAEEIWQRHLATLGKQERSALLAGGRNSARIKAEKQQLVDYHMGILFSFSRDEQGRELIQDLLEMKRQEEKRTAKIAQKKERSATRAAISAKHKKKNNKAQHQETGRPEESVTQAVKKEADEEARDRSEMLRFAEELWQRHLARLGEEERSAALWLGSAGGKDLLRREKHRVLAQHMRISFSVSEHERGMRLMKQFWKMDDEERKRRVEEEKRFVTQAVKKEADEAALLAGEVSLTVGSGKSALDQAIISTATEESVTEAGGESSMREEAMDRSEMLRFAEELWKHRVLEQHKRISFSASQQERGVRLMKQFWKMREEESESEKRSEMQPTAPGPDFHTSMPPEYQEIQRALLHIQDKLAKKKSSKMDKEILRLLNGISNMLDQGGDDGDREDTNGGTNTTMVKSDNEPADASATNSITIQAETLGQMVKDFSDSVRREPAIQEHMPMVGSDKLLIQPEDPSFTDSVTRLGLCSLQDGLDHDEMAEATSDEESSDDEMADEAKDFADYRRSWEYIWGQTCGSFRHMTSLSSMQFTYYTPRCNPPSSQATTPETLQIFSIKLSEITGGLGWPLSVYGVVAVRDVVDHNRNFLFYCDRDNSQKLTQDDPFLRLIGPSRAVVFANSVNFEIELQVKGTTRSEDKALITKGRNCRHIYGHAVSTIRFENCFCKIESSVQLVRRTTQATILAVQVANSEKCPFQYGARVACSSLPGKLHVNEDNQVTLVTDPASGGLVMVDSKDGAKLKGGDGYLHLSRNVVSVENPGRLDVEIQAYSESGVIAAQRLVKFPAKYSKISREKCFFGDVKVVITVAWSLVATDKRDAMSKAAYV